MGRSQDKLIERFVSNPTDFHYSELVRLLNIFGFSESNKGKTSGSRVAFYDEKKSVIMLDIPHPGKILKPYQIKQIKAKLKEYGYL
jgi:hypothetical protein